MNVELLREVAAYIAAEPKRINMNVLLRPDPTCGTVGCIAGWACALSGKRDAEEMWDVAEDLLGLAPDESCRLFTEPFNSDSVSRHLGWPKEFAVKYMDSEDDGDAQGKADATVARIEHFIKTKGAE